MPEYALAVLAILHRLSYLMLDFIELNNFVIDGFRMFNIVALATVGQLLSLACSEAGKLGQGHHPWWFIILSPPHLSPPFPHLLDQSSRYSRQLGRNWKRGWMRLNRKGFLAEMM